MENDSGYLLQLFDLAYESAEKGAVVIDLIIAFIVVFGIRSLEKRGKIPAGLSSFIKHRVFEDDKWRLAWVFAIVFILQMIFISPYSLFKRNHALIEQQQRLLDDKSPKLEGFIDQYMCFGEPGTANTIIVPQIHINNFGHSASLAESFKLKLALGTNHYEDIRPIDIPDYYQWQQLKGDEITVYRLARQELISEKTGIAIEPGSGPRGWLAYRVPGTWGGKQVTNFPFIISFLDVNDKEISVTNGVWRGKNLTNFESFDIPRTYAGSVNLVYTNYQLQSDIVNGWRPPELAPDCTNVVIFLGSQPMPYSRFMAEIAPDEGTHFAIKDVPDFFLAGIENSPDYDPSQPDMWLRDTDQFAMGGKTFSFPVQPIIVSNRLYVEVETPFSNERHKLVMSDSFDSQLHKPRRWDRNYSTNYFANAKGVGGVYAYELVNELKNPVLQVIYAAPNVVLVNGIFQVDSNSILAAFGQQPQLITFQINDQSQTQGKMTASLQVENFHETLTIYSNETIASFGQRLTNEFFRPIFKYQRPMFKYPSNRNLGAVNDLPLQTNDNKSDTKTIDTKQ